MHAAVITFPGTNREGDVARALRQAGVTDHRVTEALEKTPRDAFVPKPFADSAWVEGHALPVGTKWFRCLEKLRVRCS